MKKTIIISIIAVSIGLCAGYFLGYLNGGSAIKASYASKIAAVNKFFPQIPNEVTSISGKIEKINGQTITITANPISQNPFIDISFPQTRVVNVTSATQLTRIVPKDPATFQKEMTAFQNAIQEPRSATGTSQKSLNPPSSFVENNIKLSDIKIGNIVSITAASNILSVSNFSATKIQVLQ